jgi:hypothetical protein
VPRLGAPGVATGAIAIGMAATSTSTTITITIRTTILTATSTARDKVIGSITRNTAETLLTETEEQRIDLEATTGSNPAAVTVQARETDRVVALELQIVPVVAELQTGQAAVEPQTDPVVAVQTDPVVAVQTDPVAVELQTDPVAVELRTGQAAVEPQTDPVVAVPRIGLGAAVLQIVRVVEPARGRRRARLAALPRTKSAIAPHHRDLVPVLAAEDLAAAAETMREPAAAEVIRA